MSEWVFKKDLLPAVTDYSHELILCRETKRNGKVYRSFAVQQHSDTTNRLLLGKDAHFYECVPGDVPRKMYFDLDFPKIKGEKSKARECLRQVMSELRELGSKCILVFDSSSETKDSYHVVSADLIARDNHHAKYIQLNNFGDTGVDSAVYSKFQQFRCYRSCKIDTTRIKRITNIGDLPTTDPFELLKLSTLTRLTGEEKELPFYDESRPIVRSHTSCDFSDAFDSLEEIIASVSSYMEFISQNDNLVIFRRHTPSFCEECQRDHDGENPFMIIRESGDVVMYCRRSTEKGGVFMGNIAKKVELVQEVVIPKKTTPTRKLVKLC